MTGGYFRVANALVDDGHLARLKCPSSARVLLVLMRHANKDGRCYPGRRRICELAGVSSDTADKALADLMAAGLISRVTTEYRAEYCIINMAKILDHVAPEDGPASGPLLQPDMAQSYGQHGPVSGPVEQPNMAQFFGNMAQSYGQHGPETGPEGILRRNTKKVIAHSEEMRIQDMPSSEVDRNRDDFKLSSEQPRKRPRKSGPSGADIDGLFETFWLSYPRRVDRARARKAYPTALAAAVKEWSCDPSEAAARIATAAERYAQERRAEDAKFTKHATTWLNARCFLDEPQAAQAVSVAPARPRRVEWEPC